MALFESLLLLLVAAVVLSGLARRIHAPYPTLLALGGAALALAPVAPTFHLDPQLALALFVAPILLDAGYDASPRDLKANWLPLASLVFVAVGLTTVAVAVIARWLVPGIPWAAAVALGAIVAPPDAAAATAVLRPLRLPHRLVVVLEGESLLNDASALLIYRLAVGAAMAGGSLRAEAAGPAFLLSIVGSLVAGPVWALIYGRLTRGMQDVPSAIVLQFVSTFGLWIVAERVGLSPILTTVASAMVISRFAPVHSPARLRVPSYAVWETVVLVLNAMAFMLIGLQLRPILAAAPAGELRGYLVFTAAVLATCIAMRLAWVMAYGGAVRLKNAVWGGAEARGDAPAPTLEGGLVVSWAGMRGIVTLAAALALPARFPNRDLLLFTAFGVVLGTLVIQGLTLRPLLLWLSLKPDDTVEREVRTARVALAEEALDAIEGEPGHAAEALRRDFRAQRDAADEAEDGEGAAELPVHGLKRLTLERRRARLLDLRRKGVIGDDAFHRLEEELDFADLAVGAAPA